MKPLPGLAVAIFLLSAFQGMARAEVVTVASASNFTPVMKMIAEAFENRTGHETRISYASTGKLYAQILHGAPFEVFLSADRERPALLAEKGLAEEPFTLARGKLVLWTRKPGLSPDAGTLKAAGFRKIAMANPKTAPYGAAAQAVIDKLGLAGQLDGKLVYGDNIAQTFQFVATGNADFGFVALAQTLQLENGSLWIIPDALYNPVRQDVVLLESGRSNPAAVAFVDFLKSAQVQQLLRDSGYETE